MKTPGSKSELFEENRNAAAKVITESASAITEIYSKQFQLSYDFFTHFLNSFRGARYDSETFHFGPEVLQKNMAALSELSGKTMSAMANINKQMDVLAKENLKIWSDLLKVTEIEKDSNHERMEEDKTKVSFEPVKSKNNINITHHETKKTKR